MQVQILPCPPIYEKREMRLIDERPQWLMVRIDEYLAGIPPRLRNQKGALLLKEARGTLEVLVNRERELADTCFFRALKNFLSFR